MGTDSLKLNEGHVCVRRMPSSGMLHLVALVRTDALEECIASITRVERIGELGTTLTVTINRSALRRNPLERRFLQEPHGVKSQKTAFFIVNAVKPSNLT
jgi:hypothetical protein